MISCRPNPGTTAPGRPGPTGSRKRPAARAGRSTCRFGWRSLDLFPGRSFQIYCPFWVGKEHWPDDPDKNGWKANGDRHCLGADDDPSYDLLWRSKGSMMGWFRRLLPREDRFFDLFAQHRKSWSWARRRWSGCWPAATFDALARRSCRLRSGRRRSPVEVLLAVRRSFITPFDRGDIKDLIHVDGRRDRHDAQDSQDGETVRADELRAADAADGTRSSWKQRR